MAELGKTARHYKKNAKSRAKHGKARASLKIRKGSSMDASKQPDGSYKAESRKTNRGRGGAKRK